jgi:hypothetical protein
LVAIARTSRCVRGSVPFSVASEEVNTAY